MGFLLDLAWRELRVNGRSLWVFCACLMLGVILVTAAGGMYRMVSAEQCAGIRQQAIRYLTIEPAGGGDQGNAQGQAGEQHPQDVPAGAQVAPGIRCLWALLTSTWGLLSPSVGSAPKQSWKPRNFMTPSMC